MATVIEVGFLEGWVDLLLTTELPLNRFKMVDRRGLGLSLVLCVLSDSGTLTAINRCCVLGGNSKNTRKEHLTGTGVRDPPRERGTEG